MLIRHQHLEVFNVHNNILTYDTKCLHLPCIVISTKGIKESGYMEKQRKSTINRRKILTAAIAEAMILTTLAGCADKRVDYGTDTENMTKSTVCNVKDFSTKATYSDEFSVQTESGNVNIDISAKVELPDCKTMSVVEVEKIPYSAKLKEKVLNAYFGESQIYYYDKEYWTKTQLQNLIDSINSSTTPTDTSGTENRAELLKEYTHYLENAGDEWTIATEYDSCDEFVGKKGNTWYNVNFVADGDENKWLSGIGAGPIEGYTKKAGSNEYEWSNIFNDGYVQQYFGPDSLMEYDTIYDITDSQDTSGEEIAQKENVEMLPLENIFDIARDELKNNADEYVLDTNVKYYTLKLAYIRVNNRTDMQKYSYIPVWSLELLQKGTANACPVFINAIDGSVIHSDDLS